MFEDEEETGLQSESSKTAHLKPWQFKKGQSGNPSGKKPGTISLKVFAKNYIQDLTEEEKLEFMEGIDKKTIWEMAEGKAKQDMELSGSLSISDVLNKLENGQTFDGQTVENESSIQDTKQESAISPVQEEQSSRTF